MTSPTEFAVIFGSVIGLLALFSAVTFVIGAWKRGGQPPMQRRHRKAVKKDIKLLSKTEPAAVDSVRQGVLDLEYLCPRREVVSHRRRLKHRLFDRGVMVRGMRGEDANGEKYYLAEVDGRGVANRRLEPLVRDAKTLLQASLRGEDPPGTLSEYYFGELQEGRVDYDDLERSVRGDCLTRLKSNLRRNGELDLSKLRDRFVTDFRYPPSVVDEKLRQLTGRDVRSTKDDTLVWQRY